MLELFLQWAALDPAARANFAAEIDSVALLGTPFTVESKLNGKTLNVAGGPDAESASVEERAVLWWKVYAKVLDEKVTALENALTATRNVRIRPFPNTQAVHS